MFDAYVAAGGNFLDTADVYAGGRSEELLGGFVAQRGLRDQLVLAIKFGFNAQPGNPHAGGNGRKHIHRAPEGSLRRLQTDYVDLYWLHVWDMVTPVEELLQTLGDLVRASRIRYFALSDMPAWYVTRAATLAQAHGVPGPVAMQLEYSLVARDVEREHIAAARECGLGLLPWSPLAGGFLAGKYARQLWYPAGRGRGPAQWGQPVFGSLHQVYRAQLEHSGCPADRVAAQLNRPLAQVALAWVARQPGVTPPLVGASQPEQLQDLIAALDIRFSAEQAKLLDEASTPGLEFFSAGLRRMVFGGADVKGWL